MNYTIIVTLHNSRRIDDCTLNRSSYDKNEGLTVLHKIRIMERYEYEEKVTEVIYTNWITNCRHLSNRQSFCRTDPRTSGLSDDDYQYFFDDDRNRK